MFHEEFAHYLSYGATDQETVRELTGYYSGLIVPGTVAAFQREGTGGFVLSLSATAASPDYAIDPRFPLFQQALPRPKRSHSSLAELLGVPTLVRAGDPTPSDFTPEVIDTVAQQWAQFNGTYERSAGGKFAKYARRLGEAVQSRDAKGPLYVLAPYLVSVEVSDPWWAVSTQLFDAVQSRVAERGRCVRVVATKTPTQLAPLLDDIPDERVIVWVSDLEELNASASALSQYASAISSAAVAGKAVFALYGGFFSVLLQSVGLKGSSHGIGYGEYRRWVELPVSGPPPAR